MTRFIFLEAAAATKRVVFVNLGADSEIVQRRAGPLAQGDVILSVRDFVFLSDVVVIHLCWFVFEPLNVWLLCLLSQNTIGLCQFFILFHWQCEPKRNYEIVTKSHRCYSLAFQALHSRWSLSSDEIAVAELPDFVGSPRVAGTASRQNDCEATLR